MTHIACLLGALASVPAAFLFGIAREKSCWVKNRMVNNQGLLNITGMQAKL